jgi:hypothetical protein
MLYKIPSTDAAKTTIQPGGFIVIWCDKEMHQGPTHVDFALSAGGESIGLIMPDGVTFVDQLTYTAQTTDISYGRNPDGGDTWQQYPAPTPGASNTGEAANLPPAISNIAVSPENPTIESAITISATITDPNGNLDTAWVTYGPEGAITSTMGMTTSGDSYSAEIGTFTDDKIYFFVTAKDDKNAERISDTLFFEIGYEAPNLLINEFLASNDGVVSDPDEDSDDGDPAEDFVEIYNAGATAVNIAGYYVSDKSDNLVLWQIPASDAAKTTIQPYGFLVLWCDKEMHQGELHIDVKLSGDGEFFALTAPNGMTVIDSLSFGAQTTDVSYGRIPDGSDTWEAMTTPTPGAANSDEVANRPPAFGSVTIEPDTLTDAAPVTINAEVADPDNNLSTVTVTYGTADAITNTASMTLSGNLYSANLGTFADGSKVYYFITATDAEGLSAVTDTSAFTVGYIAPVLYINEFLASNDSSNTDENGEYDDWVEIYNPGTEPVDIGGMYFSDKLDNLTNWQIPTTDPSVTTIPAGGFIVIWADKQMEQGPLHVDAKLSADGEDIVLTAPNGTKIIDSLTFGAQTTDVSYGRYPDGSDNWQTFTTPTPGASNQ